METENFIKKLFAIIVVAVLLSFVVSTFFPESQGTNTKNYYPFYEQQSTLGIGSPMGRISTPGQGISTDPIGAAISDALWEDTGGYDSYY